MKIFVLTFGISFLLCFCAIAQTGQMNSFSEPQAMMLPCSDCHICDKPTVENPCLKACPRHSWKMTTEHSEAEAPDIIIIDELESLYSPVEFHHKNHAHWTVMQKGCSECHHYSPEGPIPACNECHTKEINPKNLRQVGLKGAYHQQCMGCHQEWSLSTDCNFCHVKLDEEGGMPEIQTAERALITEPDRKVYNVEMDDGPVVTFHHQQHSQLYGIDCMECHKGEGCGVCHTPQDKRTAVAQKPEDPHARCFNCHEDASCDKCHLQKETEGFTHAQTGWPLSRYHKPLTCNACHPKGKKISRLNRSCTSCHKNWSSSNFDHGNITGVTLGEIHMGFDCSDCHLNKRFDKKPSCDGCHEGYAYPDVEPEF
ncbi:hypothetical protein AMJ86_03235 [bacterium SM23_57]|nr:MAG: hypothetical protein AMJ86_03235 [bacterium SM23_57]